MSILASILILIGVACLAFPALYVDGYARQLHRIQEDYDRSTTQFKGELEKQRKRHAETLTQLIQGWTRGRSRALRIGFACYAVAAVINLGLSIAEAAGAQP